MPGTLNTIGNNAFQGLSSLTCYITIPSSCTSLGTDAFASTGIWGCTVPNSVSTIGMRAFAYCKNLTTANLSCSRTSGDMFESCTALTNLTLNYGVKTIGNDSDQGTFENCTALKEVTFPSSISSLENAAFWNCTSLEKVNFLNVGDNFNNLTFGSSIWTNCKLRYVLVSRGNFGGGSYCIKSCGGGGGGSHYCAGDGTIYYTRYSAAYLHANSWSGGWGWFTQYNAWSTVRYWDSYPGNGYDARDWQTSNITKEYCGFVIRGYVGNSDNGWEGSESNFTVYQLNHSKADTAWTYVTQKGYKFCGAPDVVKTDAAYDTNVYCNDYVYPKQLDNLMAIP